MKIFAIAVLRKRDKNADVMAEVFELNQFGFFQRGSVKEFMQFFMKTVAGRCAPGTRTSVEEQGYKCHCQVRMDNLACVIVCDQEYPPRVAYSLAAQVMDDFQKKYQPAVWLKAQIGTTPMPELEGTIAKYQNPAEADKLMKVQQDLDETKIILHKTIESVLERGEKIDNLVERSEDLSRQSKVFYTQAKKTNSCCTYM